MSNKLIEKKKFPAPTAEDQDRIDGAAALQLHFDAFNLLSDGVYAGNADQVRALVARINAVPDRLKASLCYQQQPATEEQMVEHLMVLVKSFPDRQGEDARIMGRALAEEVGRMRPSIGALEAACGHLRRTVARPLYIADVVQAIAEHEGKFDRWINALDRLDAQRSMLAEKLAALKPKVT